MTTLETRNTHLRDQYITFYEEGHRYEVHGKDGFTSVTTWIHCLFEKFDADAIIKGMMMGKNWKTSKYFGMTCDEIKKQWDDNGKEASSLGTLLHNTIECFSNNDLLTFDYNNGELYRFHMIKDKEEIPVYKTVEWQFFLNFIQELSHLKPYRTEWLVYDEEYNISGSIDMVYKNPDGSYSIYDWKRSKQIETKNGWGKKIKHPTIVLPDCNYTHYSLQLNTYKFILEKCYNIKIVSMHLVRLHPNATNYEIYDVPDMQEVIICLLKNKT